PDSLVAARLAAVVRRSRPGLVQVGDIAIDTVERRVTRAGRPVELLPREYALLLFLAKHAGDVVDHATLHRALWGRCFDPGTNVIAVHVSRLRGKLGRGGVTVLTERGKGYRLAAPIAGGGKAG
ncbi:MAG: response regulator transcription factor, partial [Acetobacteraceae bacterium]|nr:response regulator transcription factor [Acetobacteraceae bacterium]